MHRSSSEAEEPFGLAEPQVAMLDSYRSAVIAGWSPDNARDERRDHLAEIERDPIDFVRRRSDAANADVTGHMFTLPDGAMVPRLPMRERWIWDGSFAGRIGLRYLADTDRLPSYALGHIGYAIVPWRQNRGYARRALKMMLGLARELGMHRVELTCDAANVPSQKVILANGGRFLEAFEAHHYGPGSKYRFVIALD